MSDLRVIPSIEQLRQRDVHAGARSALRPRRASSTRCAPKRPRCARSSRRAAIAAVLVDEAVARIETGAARRLRASIRPRSSASSTPPASSCTRTSAARPARARGGTARVGAVAAGYTNLEYDLDRGARGRRDVHAERCSRASRAPRRRSSSTTTPPRRCWSSRRSRPAAKSLISRGELVEIGGGFRVPDVMAQSGAILREVGTTNRTRAVGLRGRAVGDRTGLILRVHPSNFRIEGFTERPALAGPRRTRAPVQRSGRRGSRQRLARTRPDRSALPRGARATSRSSRTASRAGADVVCFSGDKLLGGPQAGIIAGTRACARHDPPPSADARPPRGQDDLRRARGRRLKHTQPDTDGTRCRSSG